ncbi:mRNA cap guanine-N7 methyltransferase [Arachnomyces sp. PD_36]|nr:mRNA cap guanine-N7 methyltransferase [Arachnomyces sp. PD_36]
MYDPARDIYTSAADAAPVNGGSGKHREEADAQTTLSPVTDKNVVLKEEQHPQTLVQGHGPLNPMTFIPEGSFGSDTRSNRGLEPSHPSTSTLDKQNLPGPKEDRPPSPTSQPKYEPNSVQSNVSRRAASPSKHTMEESKSSETHHAEGHPPKSPMASFPKAQESENASDQNKTTKDREMPHERKRKLLVDESNSEKPKPAAEPPASKRKRQEERSQKNRKRGNAALSIYSRRDRSRTPPRASNQKESLSQPRRSRSPKRHSPDYRPREGVSRRSPSPIRRSPTPESHAPPRQRKRPGGGARIGQAEKEAVRRRQEERERAIQEETQRSVQDRGVHDVVRQHYNAVPERGREWRKTDSRIKGLRSFNNWVKSTIIQKFSPDEEFLSRANDVKDWADGAPPPAEQKRLLVIDLGCGKGGDLGKWQLAPQPIDLYLGLDPAEISIEQARERYSGMRSGRGRGGGRGGRGGRRGGPIFHAEFYPKDCFGEWLGDVPLVQRVGIDGNVGPGGSIMSSRWGGGGFDIVASMFTMHYAFESEEKARQLLRNVAGVLKKGGRFLGVGPNSDVLSAKVVEFHQKRKQREEAAKKADGDSQHEDGEVDDAPSVPEWGNSIYRVRFPGDTPEDGIFRPAFGWKYSYFMEEAVEEVPEYVVPWEAFRALTEDYNLELQYRKPFLDIWKEEKDDPVLGPLSERMGVRGRDRGPLLVSDEELEAVSFYHAFCFYKV